MLNLAIAKGMIWALPLVDFTLFLHCTLVVKAFNIFSVKNAILIIDKRNSNFRENATSLLMACGNCPKRPELGRFNKFDVIPSKPVELLAIPTPQ